MTVRIQQRQAPIAEFLVNGRPVPVYVTEEWRRPLEEMARMVNLYETQIAALKARVTALEP